MKFRFSASRRLFSAGTVLLGLCAAHQAHADDYYVTNTSDSGPGSLRQAIIDSNNSVGGDLILFDNSVFGTPQTISAASAYPRFTGETYIIGPDSSLLTVGNFYGTTAPGALFSVLAGARVTIGGLSGNNASTFVNNSGTLTIQNCVMTNCSTVINNTGQGIAQVLNCDMTCPNGNYQRYGVNNAGSLIARRCAFRGPSPNAYAGPSYGVYNSGSSIADIGGCTFIGNNSGILDLDSSTVSANDCTFIGGTYSVGSFNASSIAVSNSTFILGGGNYGLVNAARATIVGCAFHPYPTLDDSPGNSGIYSYGTLSVTNSTFAGCLAGIQSDNPVATTITNSTFCRNAYGLYGTGNVTLRNSLCVGNLYENVHQPLTGISGANITTGTPAEAGLQVDGEGKAVLQYNGGGTQTFALVNPGGTAVNAGNNGFVPASITTDQRGEGYPRQSGSAVDVGAFEFQAPTPPPANSGSSASMS